MQRKNYGYLNVIRVYATVMVIVLHCIYNYFNVPENSGKSLWFVLGYVNEITRTGVPLFFMISGFLLLSKDIQSIGEFYKKRFLKIAVPFVIYDIFYYVYMHLSNGLPLSFREFFKELFIQGSAYHLWFVYSILFIYLLIPFLQPMVKACSKKTAILLLMLTIFQTTIRPFINIVSPGSFELFLTEDGFSGYIGYVILGYILGKYDFSKKANIIIYTIGILSFLLTPVITMGSVSQGGEYLFSGGYAINHYIEAAAIFIFCKNHIRGEHKIISGLSSVSFGAYLIHAFILEELKRIPLNMSPSSLILLFCLLTTILSFLWGYIEKAITSRFKKQVN